jgi:hypothetical protein
MGQLLRGLTLALGVTVVAAACSSSGSGGQAAAPRPIVAHGSSSLPSDTDPAAGVKWDWDGVADYVPYLESFGGGNTFYELVWCDVEPERGHRDWSRVDDVVAAASSYGFHMFLKIRVGSCWATGKRLAARGDKAKTASLLPTDLGAYRDFVAATVSRFAPRGVHRYAVENEVNLPGFWASSAADYETLVRTAAPVIRQADPAAVVVDAGISSTGVGSGLAAWLLREGDGPRAVAAYRDWFQRRLLAKNSRIAEVDDAEDLASILGSGQRAQDVEFLDATFRLAADGVVDAYQLHFYERWSNVEAALDFLRHRLPPGFPIESWETGIFWPGGNDADAAAETAKTTALLLAGGVRPVIWLPASADTRKGELRWGLFDAEGRARPSAGVFLHLAKAAGAAGAVHLTSGPLDGVALTHDGRTDLMLWSDEGTRLLREPPAGATASRLDGSALPWSAAGLRVDGTPLMIDLAGPVESARELFR